MTVFVGFLERYSELLSFLTSFLMLVVTAIYVYFTRKQAKSAQDAFLATVMHFKESKQPCIVPSIKRVKGCAFDASKYIRIQFTFDYQLDNVGDTPALSIYTIASMQLKYSQKENVVFAHLMPNYKHVIPVNSKVEDNFHFETEEFRSILEDIQISHIKNLKRIETDPSNLLIDAQHCASTYTTRTCRANGIKLRWIRICWIYNAKCGVKKIAKNSLKKRKLNTKTSMGKI